MMEFLSGVLEEIELTNVFPKELCNKEREGVQSSVLYLCAAICDYLAWGVKNIKRPFFGKSSTNGHC